jgi:hypothetical protein
MKIFYDLIDPFRRTLIVGINIHSFAFPAEFFLKEVIENRENTITQKLGVHIQQNIEMNGRIEILDFSPQYL